MKLLYSNTGKQRIGGKKYLHFWVWNVWKFQIYKWNDLHIRIGFFEFHYTDLPF